jgi:very-short-patch-repair endonuclease
LKLILELDGGIHHTKEHKEKDKQRDEYFKTEGFKILHYENSVVFHSLELIFQGIEKVPTPPSPSGRGAG